MLKSEKQDFINSIFSDKAFFEKYILGVESSSDREEIMEILSKRIINLLLKEELNFLYMKDINKFKLSLIQNILFREMANEWVAYGEERLALSRDETVEIIQVKEHVLFLFALVGEYYQEYKKLFFKVIADSFITLVENMPNATQSNELIEDILKSPFIKDDNVAVIHTYSQLWARVRNAHKRKKAYLTDIQIKLSEESEQATIYKYELQEDKILNTPLADFDDAVLRLRNTMIKYMSSLKN